MQYQMIEHTMFQREARHLIDRLTKLDETNICLLGPSRIIRLSIAGKLESVILNARILGTHKLDDVAEATELDHGM